MKTPGEILRARHEAARPRLDAVRRQVLAEHVGGPRLREPASAGFAARLWQELFWTCRRAWLGLAAAWGLVLWLQLLAGPGASAPPVRAEGPPLLETRVALIERQRLLTELLGMGPGRSELLPGPAAPRSEAPIVLISA